MVTRKTPTKSQDEIKQELKDMGLFLPEPPETCYVLLEFACVVAGAADMTAAYDSAAAQLQAHLNEQACPRMSLVSKETYEQFMRDQLPDDEDEDDDYTEADQHPLYGRRCFWTLRRNNFPATPAALIDAVARDEADMAKDDSAYTPYDTQRLAMQSGFTEMDVRFTHFFQGKHNVKRIGDGSHDMTYAEIIWLLHQSILQDQLGDHIFFEGLNRVATDGAVPLFDVYMGS
jgi:hypothetical protein